MANPLALNKAAHLYEVLGKYIPSPKDDEDYVSFIEVIIENLKSGSNPQDYFTAIEIMTDASRNTLELSEPIDVLELFMRSLIEWRIIELVQFFRELGYSDD